MRTKEVDERSKTEADEAKHCPERYQDHNKTMQYVADSTSRQSFGEGTVSAIPELYL